MDPGSIERDGYAHLHLSKNVDYDRAKPISLRIASTENGVSFPHLAPLLPVSCFVDFTEGRFLRLTPKPKMS